MATAPWIANAVDIEGIRVRRKGFRKLVRWRREVTKVIVIAELKISLELYEEGED